MNRLSVKLLLLMLLMVLLLGTVTALIVARSFDTTQREVTRRSAEGLQAQGVAALRTLTEREAALSTATLQQGVATSQQGAHYLVEMVQLDDLANVARLVAEFAKRLEAGTRFER